jgi:hypothetical protein
VFKQTYQCIIETELVLLTHFHVDPFLMGRNLSMLDFQFYAKTMIEKINDETKNLSMNDING